MIPEYPYIGYETKCKQVPITFPPQHQDIQPGLEFVMQPIPISDSPAYKGSGKLQGNITIITGGDSGIGRAVAIGFAKEGAHMAITYMPHERPDAEATKQMVEAYGQSILLIEGDLRHPEFSMEVVRKTMDCFGKLDILILNQGVQFPQQSILDISNEQLYDTFETNIFPHFHMTKAGLPYMKKGGAIISTASVTAYAGAPFLVDYFSTKGDIVFHKVIILTISEKGNTSECSCPRPNLDTTNCLKLFSRIRQNIWLRNADEASRSAI